MAWVTQAQEKLMPEPFSGSDSLQMELERKNMYLQLLSGVPPSPEFMQIPALPEFDFNRVFEKNTGVASFYTDVLPFSFSGYTSTPGIFSPSPFLMGGTVYSAARYRINDRFSFGGYSFGARSVFTAPLPNQGINSFDTRGSTLFMQYKVSKNFKIETRVSVTQGPGF